MKSGKLALVLGVATTFFTSFLPTSPANAHEIRPGVVTIQRTDAARIAVEMTINLEALIAGIGPEHADTDNSPSALTYNELRNLPPEILVPRFQIHARTWLDGIALTVDRGKVPLEVTAISVPNIGNTKLARISNVTLATAPLHNATAFTFTYDRAFGSIVVRSRGTDGTIIAADWLKEGATSPTIVLDGVVPINRWQLISEYMKLGFIHILPQGLDHILFVLGLFFLNPALKPLLTQVTVFTVAHTMTLALGVFGVVSVSSTISEPLIAASIIYVAVENLATSRMTMWRPLVVFAFGLLHGLGFASVLRELGLPQGEYLTGLIAFNVGVEGGQLAVIALAWIITGFWFSKQLWYRARIAQPASLCIALIGAFWTFQRVFLE